jgi:hypothetical protein
VQAWIVPGHSRPSSSPGLDACGQRGEAIQQTANPPEISLIS